MTLEGKSTGTTTSGKVSCNFRACDYLDVKKVALENSGLMTLEADLPKLLKCTTLQIRYPWSKPPIQIAAGCLQAGSQKTRHRNEVPRRDARRQLHVRRRVPDLFRRRHSLRTDVVNHFT